MPRQRDPAEVLAEMLEAIRQFHASFGPLVADRHRLAYDAFLGRLFALQEELMSLYQARYGEALTKGDLGNG